MPNTGHPYYGQSYSPFDQFDQMEYQVQNSSSYYSPDNFNRVYNDSYYTPNQSEGIQFPDSGPHQQFNANAGIFADFDKQEQMSPFNNFNQGV